MLGFLLNYEEYRKIAFSEEGDVSLSESDFFTDFGKRVFEYIKNGYDSAEEYQQNFIDNVFSPEEVGRITKMQLDISRLTNKGEDVFAECVAKMKKAVATANGNASVTTVDALRDLILRKRRDDE